MVVDVPRCNSDDLICGSFALEVWSAAVVFVPEAVAG